MSTKLITSFRRRRNSQSQLDRILWKRQQLGEGHRSGKLTVIGPQFAVRGNQGLRNPMNVVRCDCGKVTVMKSARLKGKRSAQSCGCTRNIPEQTDRSKRYSNKGDQELIVLPMFEGRPIERCVDCGARVYAPCYACQVRRDAAAA